MENEKELTIVRELSAPREKVWAAWTDAAQMAQWWGPQGVTVPECEVDAREGGSLRIVMLAGPELGPMAGQRWPMQGTFQEVVEPEKLVFTNQAIDENGTVLIDGLTTVTFEDLGGRTRLTVHTVACGMSPQAPQMLAGMETGWNQQIDKLSECITN